MGKEPEEAERVVRPPCKSDPGGRKEGRWSRSILGCSEILRRL